MSDNPAAPNRIETAVPPLGGAPQATASGKQMFQWFVLLCSYLLYEKREETPLQMAFITLVRERHNEWHEKGKDKRDIAVDAWHECSNSVCVTARTLIEEGRKPEAIINAFTQEMLQGYTVDLTPGAGTLHARLREPSDAPPIHKPTGAEVQQIVQARPPMPRKGGKIVISGQ